MNNEIIPKAVIVIFGATGDLAQRKLFPSIYRLYQSGKLSDDFAVIGAARRDWSNDKLREIVKQSISNHGSADEDLDKFVSHFYYQPFNASEPSSYQELGSLMGNLESEYKTENNRVFFLAMAPSFFGEIAHNLKEYDLKSTTGWTRLVIEKPFGHDLQSAKELNNKIRESFDEKQIYRIDHYLGKEMVQNIEVIRFANGIFEHLWNNQFIANIQVISSESLGVEDRAAYYDTSGAIRDMVQNHMLQMVSLLAMEPPINLTPDEVRSEKIKVLRAFRNIDGADEVNKNFVRGQYGSGQLNGENVPSYRDEVEELATSNTETLVAGRIMIDNYRWAGVPFYIKTGKRMATKLTKIVVEFKDLPMKLYTENKDEKQPNLLVINIQPDEGITLRVNAKKPGSSSIAKPVLLSYNNKSVDGVNTPEAYEKLIYDCMVGDGTNFTHWDEVALAWEYVDSILDVWNNEEADFPNYESGSMGPKAADELLEQDGFKWCPVAELED